MYETVFKFMPGVSCSNEEIFVSRVKIAVIRRATGHFIATSRAVVARVFKR